MPRYQYTEKNVNYARVDFILLNYGKKALTEALNFVINRDCPTRPTLQDVLAAPGVRTALYGVTPRLTRPQKNLLYPGGLPSTTIKMEDLDISLASFLLRNVPLFVGNQPPSATAWRSPTAFELTNFPLESNVCLLREKRNKLHGHLNEPELEKADFLREFDEVKDIVVNIMNSTGSTLFNCREVEDKKTHPMSSELVYLFLDDFEKLKALRNIQDQVSKVAIGFIVLLSLLVFFLLYRNVFSQSQFSFANRSLEWTTIHWFVDKTLQKFQVNQGEQMRDTMGDLSERIVTLHEKTLLCFCLLGAFIILITCIGQGLIPSLFRKLNKWYSGNRRGFVPHLKRVTNYLTGRDEETVEVSRFITECKARIINIVGAPGFGKTTVALHVGHKLRAQGYKVAFIEIQRNSTVENIAAVFLKAFGLQITMATEGPEASRENQMYTHVESLKQKTIIIFDNAEDAFNVSGQTDANNQNSSKTCSSNSARRRREFSDMLAEILKRNKLVQVILTSRQKFLLSHPEVRVDEKEIEITSLSEESSAELLRKVAPTISEESALTLGRLLGGVPLLLESTAGIIQGAQFKGYLTAEDIIRDIKRKESVLSALRVDEQERMFYLIDISHSNLPTILQTIWQTVALFPESCDREAIEDILEIKSFDAKIHLGELIERYLLDYSSQTERYHMHRVLQDFGNMKRSKDREKDHEALSKFCQHFSKRITNFCSTFTVENKTESLLAFSSDYANYRKLFLSAFDDLTLCGEAIFMTFLQTSICFRVWLGTNDVNEILDAAIASVLKCGKFSDIRALCFDDKGNRLSHNGIVSIPAEDIVSEATRLCEGVDPSNSALTAYLYLIFSLVYADNSKDITMEQLVELEVLISRAYNIFELKLNDRIGMARALCLKGSLYIKMKRFPESIALYKEAIAVYETLPGGLHIEAANIFHRIGNTYQKMDAEPDKQLEYFEKAAQAFMIDFKEPVKNTERTSGNSCQASGEHAPSTSCLPSTAGVRDKTSDLSSFLMGCVQREADKSRAESIFEKGITC